MYIMILNKPFPKKEKEKRFLINEKAQVIHQGLYINDKIRKSKIS